MHTISERANPFGASGGLLDAGYFRGQVAAILARGFGILLLWQRRANERHALAQLDDRLLRDLGLSRSEAARESRKPFWRA
jgi:uncharacterized protein YjiS (DUF1127 family)